MYGSEVGLISFSFYADEVDSLGFQTASTTLLSNSPMQLTEPFRSNLSSRQSTSVSKCRDIWDLKYFKMNNPLSMNSHYVVLVFINSHQLQDPEVEEHLRGPAGDQAVGHLTRVISGNVQDVLEARTICKSCLWNGVKNKNSKITFVAPSTLSEGDNSKENHSRRPHDGSKLLVKLPVQMWNHLTTDCELVMSFYNGLNPSASTEQSTLSG